MRPAGHRLRTITRAALVALVGLAASATGPAATPALAQAVATYADRWDADLGVLQVDLPNASISVRGTPGDSVVVEIRTAADVVAPLPLLERTARGVRLVAPDNAVTLDVEIRVPERFDAIIFGSNGGAITVRRLHGSLTVANSNAAIEITGARGPVLASTSNGPITAEIARLDSRGPYSFITSNAPISVALPPGSGADVYLETDNGSISSDVELNPAPGAQAIPAAGSGPTLRAVAGVGGPLIRIRTDNGDIHLGEAASRPSG